MRISETRDLFASRIEFPEEKDAVIDRVGDVMLETPHGDESESLADVIERSGVHEYSSVDELYDCIIGNVGDGFVGRKYYDDRGPNYGDVEQVSF